MGFEQQKLAIKQQRSYGMYWIACLPARKQTNAHSGNATVDIQWCGHNRDQDRIRLHNCAIERDPRINLEAAYR